MDKTTLWQSVLAELQLLLSRANFNAWFSQSRIKEIEKLSSQKQLIKIEVPNPYVKNTIETRYQGQVCQILDRITKKRNELLILVSSPFKKKSSYSGPLFKLDFEKERKKIIKKALKENRLRPDFTFATFAVSSTNELAHAAAQTVANHPGEKYHLLFLYGGVGVGKTHLMQAVGHRILEKDPYAKVIYCTSEEFTNEIVEAIRNKSTSLFRQKYRLAKALLIDDIQFIAGKETVQQEFFHTFNAVHSAGGQIVLTSDRQPYEIEGLENRLLSRFEGGLTIDIQEPDFELRTAILLIKSQQKGVNLTIEVAKLIARHIKSTRKLEGFLTRLLSESQTKKEPITLEFCQSLLKKTLAKPLLNKNNVKPDEILKQVADYYHLSVNQLKGPNRAKPIVIPRQIAMYLIRTELKKTPLMEVGYLFGKRDHTTVMHAVEKISNLMQTSEKIRTEVEILKKKIFY